MDNNVSNKSQCSNSDRCIPQETRIKDVRLAMAFVPYQKFCTLLSPIDALKKGTSFPELYSPYNGKNKKCSPLESKKRRSHEE